MRAISLLISGVAIFMRIDEYKPIIKKIMADDMSLYQNQYDIWQLLKDMEYNGIWDAYGTREYALKVSKYTHEMAAYTAANTGSGDCDELYWKLLKLEGKYYLDSYCLYIEKDRPPKERFYLPRRKTLIKVVDILQKLEDDQLDEAFIHEPARIGKTQIITMGMAWHCCRNMELSNLYCSYKEDAGGAFLDGVKEIWTDPTYLHKDIFPDTKIVGTDAKAHTIDLGREKKYKTLSGKGLTSGLNGLYDASGWLVADDILEGIQDVLNPIVLAHKQQIFDNNLMKRKKEKCKVIYNGTIWSLHDIYMNRQEFLANNPEARDVRWEILKIPALDPVTDESNFDYDYGVGYSTKYYRMERAKFEENDDMASWFAQCQQEPIEREGAVFNPAHMQFYNGVLPNEEPLKIVAACDVALGGGDYLAMPIAYVYTDGSIYIHDVVYDNSEKIITQPMVLDALIQNGVTSAFFEANAGGEGYKDDIDRMLQERGFKASLESKYAQQMILPTGRSSAKTKVRKEQRIWDSAGDIRKFIFRQPGCQSAMYRKFMNNVYGFTVNGKNLHEDAPDALASLNVYLKRWTGVTPTRIIRSPV